jgi:hypothetical protein
MIRQPHRHLDSGRDLMRARRLDDRSMCSSPPIHIPRADPNGWDDEGEARPDSVAEYRAHLFWLRMANSGHHVASPEEEALDLWRHRRRSRSSHLCTSFGGRAAAAPSEDIFSMDS